MFPFCRLDKMTCCRSQRAESRITEAQASFQSLNKVTESVAEYFCEEPSEFKLDECCSIFNSFCERFTRALQVTPHSSSQYKSVWSARFTLNWANSWCAVSFFSSPKSLKSRPNCFPQENVAREMAEVKRKQKERLESVAKRRSTATCSLRDKDVEGVALESVLQRFLNTPESGRRARTPSPSRAILAEKSLQKNWPNRDSKKQSWSVSMSQSSLGKKNSDDKKPEKRGLLGRESGKRASLLSEDEDVMTEKEVQKLREVSQRVLHYQSSRGSVSSGECLSPITSPLRRMFQEDGEKLMSVTNGEDAPEPVKIPPLLIPKSPGGINRRHTIAIPTADLSRSDTEEDRFVPGEPENESPRNQILSLGNIGKMKSVDSFLPSIIDGVGNKVPSSTPTGKSENVGIAEVQQETDERLSSSPQNSPVNGQNKHTKTTSRLLSFFKRFGEKSKTNNRESESSNVDS